MNKQLKLIFPFKLNNTLHSSVISVQIAIEEATISFSLPFNLYLHINNAKLNKHSKVDKTYFYVFTFDALIYAKEFMDDPTVYVLNESVYKNRDELENETNKFLDEYEAKKKNQRKVLIQHEDGFCEYVTEEF